MHRLFVAIRPPEPIRALLLARMGGVSGARWRADEQLHLTLRFIGEVDRHLARDVEAALGAIRHPRFELMASGLGAFERRGRPETLWAGIAPQEPVKALHKKIGQALIRAGIEPDRRAYLPHITLARLGRESGPIGHLMADSGGLKTPVFAVDSFALFESRLTSAGAEYSMVQLYPLG